MNAITGARQFVARVKPALVSSSTSEGGMYSVELLLGGRCTYYEMKYLVGKVHTGSMVDQFPDNPHISRLGCFHKSCLRLLKSKFSNCNQQTLLGSMLLALETFEVNNY